MTDFHEAETRNLMMANNIQRLAIGLAAIAILLILLFGGWYMAQPGSDNPRGPRYVLWKIGILPFDAAVVYSSMVGDMHRDTLVVGLDVKELERRFGRLRTRVDATSDYQKHYSDRFYLDKEIRWLDDSPWLVILENGRVKELHLMKG